MAETLKTILDNWIVAIILILAIAGVVKSIAKQIRRYACYRQELEFKHELLDREMSIDEIERLVRAKGSHPQE